MHDRFIASGCNEDCMLNMILKGYPDRKGNCLQEYDFDPNVWEEKCYLHFKGTRISFCLGD
jgi:hypothetical protein